MSRTAAFFRLVLPALAALVWLLFRSGSKPTRLSYPCQQAAIGSTTIILGIPIAHTLIRLSRRLPLAGRRAHVLGVVAAAIGLAFLVDPVDRVPFALGTRADPPADYVASVFVVNDVGLPDPIHHPGVDDLISGMAAGGLDFYESDRLLPATSPEGIVGADDVVLIKVNQQWAERGGTNTDVLRGLIRCIVEHPDGFTGEIVVVENTQGRGGFDWEENNAEEWSQSTGAVIGDFVGEGWNVSGHLWDSARATSVGEYSEGDFTNGYVVNPIMDPEAQIRVSYPKFRTPGGTYVSLCHGIWNSETNAYDDDRFTFINLPVLKCHSIYGVTASVKNHMGTMTTALSTNAHAGVAYGGCGTFLAETRMPDLNVLDCIYVLARPGSGPPASYEQATRVNKLVAGTDPVALDMWAVANVLVPAILDDGLTSYPEQDPSNPAGAFRKYLDRSMNELLLGGVAVTNDLGSITAHEIDGSGEAPQPNPPPPARMTRAIPNPFRTATTLRTAGPVSADVVEIYDSTGRRVRVLDDLTSVGASQSATWDGRDDTGRRAATGLYYYRFLRDAGGDVAEGRVTLMR